MDKSEYILLLKIADIIDNSTHILQDTFKPYQTPQLHVMHLLWLY